MEYPIPLYDITYEQLGNSTDYSRPHKILHVENFSLDSPVTGERYIYRRELTKLYSGERMLKIGDFSRLARVTIKALRYYDEIGLLKPDFVNAENGYRYYAYEKLAVVNEIAAMKESGLLLEDIHRILENRISRDKRLAILRQRREDLTEEIRSTQEQINKLDRMIHSVEKELHMEKVFLRELPEVIVASYRTVIPSYEALFSVVPPMGELMKKQGAVCRVPAYCFNIYHDGEYRETDIDVEICEAVVDFCKDGDGIVYKKIAAVPTAAVIRHYGEYRFLGKSYGSILEWIKRNKYKASGNPRESYIDGIWNKQNSDEWLTEIEIPIKKQAV